MPEVESNIHPSVGHDPSLWKLCAVALRASDARVKAEEAFILGSSVLRDSWYFKGRLAWSVCAKASQAIYLHRGPSVHVDADKSCGPSCWN